MPTLVHSGRESNGYWVLDNAELGHLQTLLDDPCRKSVTDNQSETFSYHKDMQKIFFNPFLLLFAYYSWMTSVSNLSMTGNQYHLPDNKVQNEDTFSMNSDKIVFLSGIILVFVIFFKEMCHAL